MGSTVARVWPAVTVWPVTTSTAVTLPDTPKLRSAVLVGSIVPEADTVCFIVPVVTLTTWVVTSSGEDAELPVPSHSPRIVPTTTTTTATAAMVMFRLRRPRRRGPGTSWPRSPPSTAGISSVLAALSALSVTGAGVATVWDVAMDEQLREAAWQWPSDYL